MQAAPTNYNSIYEEGDYDVLYKVNIDGTDYDQDKIWSMKSSRACFTANTNFVGNALVGQIDLTVTKPEVDFSKMACIKPYIRLYSRPRRIYSGWLQKGQFYIDNRETDESDGITTLVIKGYDLMRKTNQLYPSSTLQWDATHPTAFQVVKEIASHMFGVSLSTVNTYPTRYIESETVTLLSNTSHIVGFPAQYTMAEVLGSIAAMYGSNFIISDTGKLKMARLMDLPTETFLLVDEKGNLITFGGYGIELVDLNYSGG